MQKQQKQGFIGLLKREKRIPIYRIKVRENEPIVLISDLHIGTRDCNFKALKRDIEYFKEINAHILINGDLFEAITPTDPRYEHDTHGFMTTNDILNTLLQLGTETLKPIANQIRLIGIGNHEYKLIKHYHINITKLLIEELERISQQKIYYGRYWGMVVFENYDQKIKKKLSSYELAYHHGWGGSPKSGTKIGLKDLKQQIQADMYWIGHKHQTAIYSEEIYTRTLNYLVAKPHWLISTGAYHQNNHSAQESYTSYAEQKGLLTSSAIPFVILRFIDGKPQFELGTSRINK
ncbi:MAG: hypothetical protein KatS3mg087_1526 [Patescibacteria group bacterium]|nr:MAG: hypothetical protein KatS3mg087_1526 [Patescibacteria group bacterium]